MWLSCIHDDLNTCLFSQSYDIIMLYILCQIVFSICWGIFHDEMCSHSWQVTILWWSYKFSYAAHDAGHLLPYSDLPKTARWLSHVKQETQSSGPPTFTRFIVNLSLNCEQKVETLIVFIFQCCCQIPCQHHIKLHVVAWNVTMEGAIWLVCP